MSTVLQELFVTRKKLIGCSVLLRRLSKTGSEDKRKFYKDKAKEVDEASKIINNVIKDLKDSE